MATNKYDFEAEVCECCGQAKTYALAIDPGTALIVKAVAAAVRRKGINVVHPSKEMEVPAKDWTYQRAITEGVLTPQQIANLTRARVHGLIARLEGEAGNWVLTRKGAQFLRGARIAQIAVVQKSQKGNRSHKESYWKPDVFNCTINDFDGKGARFEGIDFQIEEGRIIVDPPIKSAMNPQQVTMF